MITLEYKLKGKQAQYRVIDDIDPNCSVYPKQGSALLDGQSKC